MHIILLRGLARETAHWLHFPQQLQHTLGSEWKIHCIDFPGCGNHYQKPALDSIHSMTDYAHLQLTELQLNQPVYVIGISMGGMVALNWAQQFPAQIAGVALINSSAGDQPLHWRLRPRTWPAVIAALLLPIYLREYLVLRHVSNDRANFTTHLQHWLEIQRQHPVRRAAIITMLGAAARFRPLTNCAVAGLIIASEGDRFVSCNASKELARRFNWPLQLHPSAGHDLSMDAPGWLCTVLAGWLTSCKQH